METLLFLVGLLVLLVLVVVRLLLLDRRAERAAALSRRLHGQLDVFAIEKPYRKLLL
jgi:hypothetical protein